MKIELKEIPIRDLVIGYINEEDQGVIGYSGKLNIRPAYQREFVYKDQQRDKVLETVQRDFPLNVMYWAKNDLHTNPGTQQHAYEVLDGQQRATSICEYVAGKFSISEKYFNNLTSDQQKQILDYKLMVYICEGTDSEKLDWFRTINIAGEKLTDQELLNAVYTGSWLSDAKKYFSKKACPAYGLASRYMKGSPIRQEFLETVLEWISYGHPAQYMAAHQHDANALELWTYFQTVIEWVDKTFPDYRNEMKGLAWGSMYNRYKDEVLDPAKLAAEVSRLMLDEDVGNKSGIYEYVLSGSERCLNIRTFGDGIKRTVYERQKGLCADPTCNKPTPIEEMEGDHITPWRLGGKTNLENCQMLCRSCNRRKGGK